MDKSYKHVILLLSSILLASPFGFCQKLEVEKRIKKGEFPKKALQYLEEEFEIASKIKWYKEMSGAEKSFEAKFTCDGKQHSVEFYEDGQLMDVETEIPYHVIPVTSRKRMEARWNKDFKKSRVRRVQKQQSDLGTRYEIIVRGKKENNSELYEYLFESDGRFVQSLHILGRPDNLNLY